MEIAVTLGVSQKSIRNDYYFVDLPRILEIKREQEAQRLIQQLQILTYPNWKEDKDRTRFINELQRMAGVNKTKENKLDRNALEQLRLLMS